MNAEQNNKGRLIVGLLILLLTFWVIKPLLLPVIMGAVFAVLFFPWVDFLTRKNWNVVLSSLGVTLIATLLFLFPTGFLIFIAVQKGLEQAATWQIWKVTGGLSDFERKSFFDSLFSHPMVSQMMDWATDHLSVNRKDFVRGAQDMAINTVLKLADYFGDFFSHLPSMLMAAALVILSMFFFLLDGRKIVEFIKKHSFFSMGETQQLVDSMAGMCRSVILAIVVSGFAQALVFSIACLILGVPNFTLIASLVFLASFIPVVGSAPVTFSVAMYQLVTESPVQGVSLILIAILVSVMDNFIRPWILKDSGHLHPLLAFLAAVGGLQLFGITGIFLGPIVAGVGMVTLGILLDNR